MRKINRRDFLKAAGILAAASALTACGGSDSSSAAAGSGAAETAASLPAINEIKLGEDFQDVTADIKILTNRTDIVDTVYAGYAEQFHQLYPNITVTYEALTDYEESLTLRIMTGEWGDICFIPTSVSKADLASYFVPLGDMDTLEPIYNFIGDKAFDGKVYGIANGGNADGVAYNKRVWQEAGITEAPATPDEFLDDLQTIKDNTDAIPLYTNYAAGWTMSAWDAYIGGGATADPEWMNITMPQTHDPFAPGTPTGDAESGPYAVYNVLYQAVSRGLTEDDPTTTDWEGSKGMINRGEIGTMVLGSWAIVQMQDAGENGDDIGYMPFPISVDGVQYASAGADYCYGINNNISDDEKIASMLYIKWLSESSNFSYDQGGIPVLKSQEYPETLAAFDGIELIADTAAPSELADLATSVQQDAELMLNADQTHVQRIVEAAINGDETLDDIVADWNADWNEAVDANAPEA